MAINRMAIATFGYRNDAGALDKDRAATFGYQVVAAAEAVVSAAIKGWVKIKSVLKLRV